MAKGREIDIELLFAGDRVAIARAISAAEDGRPGAEELLRQIFPKTGRAYRIGITGPPGAGKSTLTNMLGSLYRRQGLRVGIIAVDPTSPFTGGALLGDRVRMTDVETDDQVFIRSMASRGSLGGLSRTTIEAADILDAAGKDIVLMETVGVGQSELDIAGAADTTLVVLVPESGDSIQAMKAGLMEIADSFVLNKADRPGADQAVRSIHMILHIRGESTWAPSVVKTVAIQGEGIEDVAQEIAKHRLYLERSGEFDARRERRLRERIESLVRDRLHVDFWDAARRSLLKDRMPAVKRKELSPYDMAEQLVAHFHAH